MNKNKRRNGRDKSKKANVEIELKRRGVKFSKIISRSLSQHSKDV